MKTNKLFLVDCSSLFFRAFYAVRPLTTPQGLPANAIYGYFSMALKLLKDYKPSHIAFCYDVKEPSFRKDIYGEYKANRAEMPEDLIPQIAYIKRIAPLLGIQGVEKIGFEADDIIGTLTHTGLKNNCEVYIVSGDKDFSQLVQPGVYILDTMKDLKLDAAGVIAKWAVKPEQFIDYLALMGDASDNIPGVAGVGPKTASQLIADFGSLDNLYANLTNVKSDKMRAKLSEQKDNAYLSQKLVTIHCDVDVEKDLHAYEKKPIPRAELDAFLQEVNFKTFGKTIDELVAQEQSTASAGDHSSVQTTSSFDDVPMQTYSMDEKGNLTPQKPVAVSASPAHIAPVASLDVPEVKFVEATDMLKWPVEADVWFFENNESVYAFHAQQACEIVTDPAHLSYREVANVLQQALLERKFHLKGHDLKSLFRTLGIKDLSKNEIIFDSTLASYALRPGESIELTRVLEKYLQESLAPDTNRMFAQIKALEALLMTELKEKNLLKIYNELDLPMIRILFDIENRGIKVDADYLKKFSDELAKDLHKIETSVHEAAGEKFNIASPKQLAVVLFDKLKLPAVKKTKTGYSTDSDVLEKLKDSHPMVSEVLQYREVAKLKSTYVDSLPLLADEKGLIHTTFQQTLTTTGRLSSRDPNLQNIPIKTARGARVRKAFVAQVGYQFLSVDYSQIELRILAHMCSDENLIKAFEENLDIHAMTAAEVFDVPLKDVTDTQRRSAKAVNFGIAYGQGAFGLAEVLNIPRGEASDIIKRYFQRFSKVKDYIESTIHDAHEKGYVEMLSGRRRYVEELQSRNIMIKKAGERAAINAPIQGTASDIVKKAMIELSQKVKSRMILQIHDEIIFEDKIEMLKSEESLIRQTMEGVAQLKVPLKVNLSYGLDWDL